MTSDRWPACLTSITNRPSVKFGYAAGWRTASELLPLEWRNIDWAGRCVRLDAHTTKNGEDRSFPFTADIEAILKGRSPNTNG